MSCWIDLFWNNQDFEWNPSDYGNITQVNIPVDRQSLFLPDIVLYEDSEKPLNGLLDENNYLIIYNDGLVYWSRPGVVKIKHRFDLYKFPFDEQIISLTFSSWSFVS